MESKTNEEIALKAKQQYQCHKCNEAITSRVVFALGKNYHPEHFLCRDCDKQIKDDIFNIQQGEPVCNACYLERYTSTCAGCKEPIHGTTISAMGNNWHEHCFVCDGACKQPLKDSSFFEREGKAYCRQDYEDLFAVRCAKCEKPITENAIVAMNAKWHSDCFCCNRCDNPIKTKTFTIEGDKPICPACTC